MRVIGVDPGTRKLGWGVIEQIGTRRRHLGHGTLVLTAESLADRLVAIEEELGAVIAEHQPDAGAVESIFFSKNAQSAAKLGHARGVILLLLRRAGLTIGEYPPAQVKRAIVGSGRADKRQMAFVVKSVLGLSELPQSDAADALAVALTHIGSTRFAVALSKSK